MVRHFIVGGLAICGILLCVMVPGFFLAPPLSTPPSLNGQTYAAARFLSEPAQAGATAFGDQCSSCHGSDAEGSSAAPALNLKKYATDFRDAESFHAAVGDAAAAHWGLLSRSESNPNGGFNELELMGKFLREMRARNERNS